MAAMLLLISALLLVVSAAGVMWIRVVTAAERRHEWNLQTTPDRGDRERWPAAGDLVTGIRADGAKPSASLRRR